MYGPKGCLSQPETHEQSTLNAMARYTEAETIGYHQVAELNGPYSLSNA